MQSFSTLQFEIEMTPMAANTLFGYWSHDIGALALYRSFVVPALCDVSVVCAIPAVQVGFTTALAALAMATRPITPPRKCWYAAAAVQIQLESIVLPMR